MAYVVETSGIPVNVVTHPPIRFRAIIAGWLVAMGVAGLLYVAGLALGFSAFDAWHAESSARGIGIGTAIWMIVTWFVALFLGGMFASWFDGRDDQTSGTLHGVTVWGLSVAATALWVALGLAHAMHGHPGGMGGMGAMHGDGGPDAMHDNGAMMTNHGAIEVLNANIAFQLTGRERGGADPIVAALIAGQNDTATALLAADTGTSLATASGTVQRLGPQVDAARAEARVVASQTAHYTAVSLWIAFISAFLALLAAALGGWMGAGHVHRVYHLREYPSRRVR